MQRHLHSCVLQPHSACRRMHSASTLGSPREMPAAPAVPAGPRLPSQLLHNAFQTAQALQRCLQNIRTRRSRHGARRPRIFLEAVRKPVCVVLDPPENSACGPCENASGEADFLPAPIAVFYRLSTGNLQSFNNILCISREQTPTSCVIVHLATQGAVPPQQMRTRQRPSAEQSCLHYICAISASAGMCAAAAKERE